MRTSASVTCHDGFSLEDLVSHNHKHNEANGENKNGGNENLSWNCGVEGSSNAPEVLSLRERAEAQLPCDAPDVAGRRHDPLRRRDGSNPTRKQQRLLPRQRISWLDWRLDSKRTAFLEFVRRLGRIWQQNPVFQRRPFFQGRSIRRIGITQCILDRPHGPRHERRRLAQWIRSLSEEFD